MSLGRRSIPKTHYISLNKKEKRKIKKEACKFTENGFCAHLAVSLIFAILFYAARALGCSFTDFKIKKLIKQNCKDKLEIFSKFCLLLRTICWPQMKKKGSDNPY